LCGYDYDFFGFVQVLDDMFPHHAFLMNGLIQGVKVCNSDYLHVWNRK